MSGSETQSKHQGRQQSQSTLRLLTYNIQAGVGARRYRHYLTQGWKHILPHAKLLANLDDIAVVASQYDVVALQEVDAGSLRSNYINQTEYLAVQAGFPYWYSQTNRDLGQFAQVGIGLLSRTRPSHIVEHRLPGRIPGRGTMAVHYGDGGRSLVLLIVHLALGRRARMRQIDYLVRLVNRHESVVLMGDFNTTSDSREMRTLLHRTSLDEPAVRVCTYPSWRPRHNIDHILTSGGLDASEPKVLDRPHSDHLPIAVKLRWPQPRLLTGNLPAG